MLGAQVKLGAVRSTDTSDETAAPLADSSIKKIIGQSVPTRRSDAFKGR